MYPPIGEISKVQKGWGMTFRLDRFHNEEKLQNFEKNIFLKNLVS